MSQDSALKIQETAKTIVRTSGLEWEEKRINLRCEYFRKFKAPTKSGEIENRVMFVSRSFGILSFCQA